jgi:hypothetical protein
VVETRQLWAEKDAVELEDDEDESGEDETGEEPADLPPEEEGDA